MGRRNPFILQNKEIPGSSQDPYFIPNILKILVHPEMVGTVGTFSNGGFPKLIGTTFTPPPGLELLLSLCSLPTISSVTVLIYISWVNSVCFFYLLQGQQQCC